MSAEPYWWRYLFGTAILILCLIVCIVGAELYAKTTFIIFVVVMASISSVLLRYDNMVCIQTSFLFFLLRREIVNIFLTYFYSFFLQKPFEMKNSTLTQCNTSTIPLPVRYTGLDADTLRGNLYRKFIEVLYFISACTRNHVCTILIRCASQKVLFYDVISHYCTKPAKNRSHLLKKELLLLVKESRNI